MCSYNCVQVELFAKTLVEHAGWNEAAHSAQGDPFTNGITQPGRLRGQRIPNRFRHHSRIVSAFDALLSRVGQTLSFIRVNDKSDFCGLRVPAEFSPRICRFDQERPHAESPDL